MSNVKVSIVEDHLEYRTILRDIVAAMVGFEVVACYATAEEALAANLKNIQILIVDIRLPGLSGIELVRRLKPLYANLQFMICSTHNDNESIFEALKAGASGYILKDSDPQQLSGALEELWQGGSPMSPFIARKVVSAFHEPAKKGNHMLSSREIEIMDLVIKGMVYTDIADKLFIAVQTVKTHIRNIYVKLHVTNKISAINKYRGL